MIRDQAELLVALERGSFDAILGTAESEQVDFKEQPYQLQQLHSKWELAKDVAALANARGGLVVLGFGTERSENVSVDTASRYRPIPSGLIRWNSYRDTIARWVHPTIAGLEGRWFPDTQPDRGVFAIVVPTQPDDAKMFVVAEMRDGEEAFPGAVGIPVRHGDAVDWLGPAAVHALLREALWWRHHGPNTGGPPRSAIFEGTDRQRITIRSQEIEASAGWEQIPFFTLHAMPHSPASRPDGFYANPGPRSRVASPEVLRERGFHIRTWVDPEVGPDGSFRSTSGRKALWLGSDGFLSAAAVAHEEFLGWYFNQIRTEEEPVALNPRVTTEFVLEFCRFVYNELRSYWSGPWRLWLSIVGFHRRGGIVLIPELGLEGQSESSWRGLYRAHRALQNSLDVPVPASGSAGCDAYRLMEELYACFGLPPNLIPYIVGKEISAQAILDRYAA